MVEYNSKQLNQLEHEPVIACMYYNFFLLIFSLYAIVRLSIIQRTKTSLTARLASNPSHYVYAANTRQLFLSLTRVGDLPYSDTQLYSVSDTINRQFSDLTPGAFYNVTIWERLSSAGSQYDDTVDSVLVATCK